jgi:tetratricopeptide (TPR) repeat protein
MYRSALFIVAAALAPACGGHAPLTSPDRDHAGESVPAATRSTNERSEAPGSTEQHRDSGAALDERRASSASLERRSESSAAGLPTSPAGKGGSRSIDRRSEARDAPAVSIDQRAERLTLLGRWGEARSLVERGLAEARARGDVAGEARLLLRRGRLVTDEVRHRGGDRAPALADLEAGHALAERAGDAALGAAGLDALGMHRYVGWFSTQDPADLTAADQQLRAALAIRVGQGDPAGLADSHFHVGLVHQMRGDDGAAQREFAESLATAERAHDELRMSNALGHLGYLAERRHDWAAAEDGYRRSLELREKLGPGPGVASVLVALAELRYARDGAAEPALRMLTRARDGARDTGSHAYVAIAGGAIARVRRDQGEYDQAVRELVAVIRATDEMKTDEDVPESYEQMALVHLLAGDPRAATADVERALARRSAPRFQALLALARARAVAPSKPAAPGVGAPAGEAQDAVVVARRALAAGDAGAALEAAVHGDDPDTLLLAARAVGPAGVERARAAAAAMSRAQELRFAREASRVRR